MRQGTKNNNHQKKNPKQLSGHSKSRLTPHKKEEKLGRKKPIPTDKKLKVIGHQLKPCIIISDSSISEDSLSSSVIKEAKARLDDHELIKVKIRLLERDERHKALHVLLTETGARLIHIIGKIALIFKASSRFSEKLSNIERFRQLI